MARRIAGHYVVVNNALNDQVYLPELGSVKAWCQGYRAGFRVDMIAWAPMLAAQPELMTKILDGAEGCLSTGDQQRLGDVARRIHGFWVERRQNRFVATDLSATLNALLLCDVSMSDQTTDEGGLRPT